VIKGNKQFSLVKYCTIYFDWQQLQYRYGVFLFVIPNRQKYFLIGMFCKKGEGESSVLKLLSIKIYSAIPHPFCKTFQLKSISVYLGWQKEKHHIISIVRNIVQSSVLKLLSIKIYSAILYQAKLFVSLDHHDWVENTLLSPSRFLQNIPIKKYFCLFGMTKRKTPYHFYRPEYSSSLRLVI
jgi:hypothetical protein